MLTNHNKNTNPGGPDDMKTIRKKWKISEVRPGISIADYSGQKNPMPQKEAIRIVLPHTILIWQNIQVLRANKFDFKFLKTMINDSKVPLYAGFNTRLSGQENQSFKPDISVAL